MDIASNNNAGINNNKVEFNYSNQRSTVWDCCINFTNKMFEYRQWKFSIENRDNIIEPLYHLVRKHALTTQGKTKDFIDHIFKLYEKGDIEISMATLRVIEYMDDELLEAIIVIYDRIFANNQADFLSIRLPFKLDNRQYYLECVAKMRAHQLVWQFGGTVFGADDLYCMHQPALDIYNMYKSK